MNRRYVRLYVRLLNFLHRPLIAKNPGNDPYHQTFIEFRSLLDKIESPVLVEIGSRNVSGTTLRKIFPNVGRFVGFDVHPGEGVDVVGDAHRLSEYFEPNSVDAVMSISVFEHLVFPWKVVMEINRVLKPGGYVFVATHPTWPTHELPWDFWRFPVAGLSHLFTGHTGFELVRAGEGLPCQPYSLVRDPPTRLLYEFQLNLGVAVIARKISDFDPSRLRWDINVNEVLQSMYPKPV